MESKKLGVIGGMGPMATSMYLEKLIKNTVAGKDQDHIDTIILNHATMPDRTQAILENKGNTFLETVKKDIELLEMAGVANIAIPCNTSHYFYNDMQAMTNIHIINMVEKTVEYIYKSYGTDSKIAILATDGTIASGIYDKACKQFNIESYHPDATMQQKVMDIIYQYKAGTSCEVELESIIDHSLYREKCTCVILGCTELSCINIAENRKKNCIDPMDILVEESIKLSGKKTVHSLVMQ